MPVVATEKIRCSGSAGGSVLVDALAVVDICVLKALTAGVLVEDSISLSFSLCLFLVARCSGVGVMRGALSRVVHRQGVGAA